VLPRLGLELAIHSIRAKDAFAYRQHVTNFRLRKQLPPLACSENVLCAARSAREGAFFVAKKFRLIRSFGVAGDVQGNKLFCSCADCGDAVRGATKLFTCCLITIDQNSNIGLRKACQIARKTSCIAWRIANDVFGGFRRTGAGMSGYLFLRLFVSAPQSIATASSIYSKGFGKYSNHLAVRDTATFQIGMSVMMMTGSKGILIVKP